MLKLKMIPRLNGTWSASRLKRLSSKRKPKRFGRLIDEFVGSKDARESKRVEKIGFQFFPKKIKRGSSTSSIKENKRNGKRKRFFIDTP